MVLGAGAKFRPLLSRLVGWDEGLSGQIHYPLVPIGGPIGTSTYATYILTPLQGHIPNSKQFSTFIATQEIAHEESLVSFDVVSLFARVPTLLTIWIAKQRVQSGTHLAGRSFLTITEIITLLKFCLDTTYLAF